MMSVPLSLLALLAEGPSYGLQLKNEFEARTGGIWPLNVGQVYTTLDRLQRDEFVQPVDDTVGAQKVFEITEAGRARLDEWFASGTTVAPRPRDELVLKLVMSLELSGLHPADVIQAERRRAVQLLQEYTRLKAAEEDPELGWAFLLDAVIFQTEAQVRWLDACEARLSRGRSARATRTTPALEEREVVR
jgi:DNA-binding PadR family transcriptional regulator